MDQQLIADKLESLRRCVERVESRRPETVEELKSDWDLQDIVSLNLTRAVQLAVDIASHVVAESGNVMPDTMAEVFDRLREMEIIDDALAGRLKGAVGFRNIAVHTYDVINWSIVFALAHERTVDFKDFARAVRTFADAQDTSST